MLQKKILLFSCVLTLVLALSTIFKRTFNEFNSSCQNVNILDETIKHAYMQPIKPGKYFKTNLNDIFYYHPCEYFPLIFKCIMNSKNVKKFLKGYI